MNFTHAATVEEAIEVIKEDLTQRNPKVIARHSLFRMKQDIGEKYSEMHIRMTILQKYAERDAITSDELVCQ